MSRKKLPPAIVVPIILRLRPETDADLLAFFASIPPRRRARAVKVALRQGGIDQAAAAVDPFSDEDVLDMLDQMNF